MHTEGEISISMACCTDVVEDGVKSWFRHTRGIQCHLYPTRSPPGAITIRLMVLYPGPKVPSAPPFFCLCRNSFFSLTDRKRNPKTELAIVLYGQNLRVGLQTVPSRPGGSDHTCFRIFCSSVVRTSGSAFKVPQADPEVLTIQNNGQFRFRISFLFVISHAAPHMSSQCAMYSNECNGIPLVEQTKNKKWR